MKTFGENDTVFARVMVMGREIMNMRIDGVASMATVMSVLREQLKSYFGIITLNLRNLTQGWVQNKAYRIA